VLPSTGGGTGFALGPDRFGGLPRLTDPRVMRRQLAAAANCSRKQASKGERRTRFSFCGTWGTHACLTYRSASAAQYRRRNRLGPVPTASGGYRG
jgi:hypothetical protein